jgi:hypothetical protein
VYLKVLTQHSPEETEDNHENFWIGGISVSDSIENNRNMRRGQRMGGVVLS